MSTGHVRLNSSSIWMSVKTRQQAIRQPQLTAREIRATSTDSTEDEEFSGKICFITRARLVIRPKTAIHERRWA